MSRKRTRIQPRRRAVAESVAAPVREAVTETGIAEASTAKPGRMLIRLIKAGWSLNGNYYPAEVLKRDGATAWPKGTQAFIDHATEDEDAERPAGSVKNLAAIQTENARWDEETQSLVAWTRLLEPWRTPLTDMAKAEAEEDVPVIGMSIRAYATAEHGERDGRSGRIITAIDQGRSVDFVTRPAAGGALLAVIESLQNDHVPVAEGASIGTYLESRLHLALTSYADDMYAEGHLTRPERITLSSAIGEGLGAYTARIEAEAPQLYQRSRWAEAPDEDTVAEALADDTRSRLQRAVSAAYGDDSDEYDDTWVTDFDPDEQYVIFHAEGTHWRQSYTTEGGIALDGDRVEVTRSTTYIPVTTPAAAEAVTAAARLSPIEVAEDLARADQALQNSPATAPVSASAPGSPPAATQPSSEGATTMSGTTTEAPTGPEAGNQNGTPVAEEVAVVAAERDQYRDRCTSMTAALTEAQTEARTARAERDAAVARALLLEGNEAGRIAVDKALTAEESGVPESMYAAIAPRVHAAIRGNVPMEDGKVNTEALEALVASAIKSERTYVASLLESQGHGTPSGLGGDPNTLSEADFEAQTIAAFEAIGMDSETAKLAAKGR